MDHVVAPTEIVEVTWLEALVLIVTVSLESRPLITPVPEMVPLLPPTVIVPEKVSAALKSDAVIALRKTADTSAGLAVGRGLAVGVGTAVGLGVGAAVLPQAATIKATSTRPGAASSRRRPERDR
jgi:hypothetical protein